MIFEYAKLSDAPSFNNTAEPFTFRIVLLNTELLEDSRHVVTRHSNLPGCPGRADIKFYRLENQDMY